MAYDDLEYSQQDGDPVELYEFSQGSSFWRYTSSAEDITKTGQVYTAEMVKRNKVAQTDDISKGGITLTFPLSNIFAKSFLSLAPEGVTTVTIWRAHFSDIVEDYIAYWKGRVLKAGADGATIAIECESVFTSLKRPGLRARYERGCRHGLYSGDCGMSMAAFKLTSAVIGVDEIGTQIIVTDAASYPDGNFTGGVMTHQDGSHRLITSHVGQVVRISKPFATSPGATDVALYPGCDKLKATCISKFDNLENFGGFPYIPYINPFSGRSVV